ncbi:uncharacterized protein LOC6531756 isoform X3 [Drosophila yakuba]|uniref:Uncharacterized protein, isoform B n=1 Tax=Drosophila yakuba TaxID=7245 RepID=A0A0R1DYU7_DROYA|nr:uncharacterized protein LOC6531756 isoform X3 [Drosophila yakuba]XP_039482244.1 uncharacterized protein LOC120445736 isoform X3 [Drosophila santomea]KRK00442.1 uncharacterized protein Dyak_GE14256, isoform B [Drosophila yakuba]
MMTGSDDTPLVEEGGLKATQHRLTIWHKVVFFVLGVISALTICVLVRLSNRLASDAEKKALLHFRELSSGRNGHRFGH